MSTATPDKNHGFMIFFINLLIMGVLSYFAFSRNHDFLLLGLDGGYMRDMVRQQYHWGLSSWFGYTSNFFQSLGNIYFPLNASLIPAYWLSAMIHQGEVNKIFTYLICSIEIFSATYFFCYIFRFSRMTAILASWVATGLLLPYNGKSILYPMFSVIPHQCSVIAETYIIMVLLSKAGNLRTLIWAAPIIFLLILHISIAYPGYLILATPLLILFGICCFFSSEKRVLVSITFVSLALLFISIGFLNYFQGLFQYTAGVFYKDQLLNFRNTWQHVSILLRYDMGTNGIISSCLAALGILGAIIDMIIQRGFRRNLAITFIFYVIGLLFFGLMTIHFTKWAGPVPTYFETTLVPLYAIYAAVCVTYIFNKLFDSVSKQIPLTINRKPFLKKTDLLFPVVIILGYIHLSSYPLPIFSGFSYHYPPANTDFIKILQDEIALRPGSTYQGRVATFTGQHFQKANWFDLHMEDGKMTDLMGNDHRLLGFTYNNIPTFFEYNPLITPIFYFFTQYFLAYPQDEQMRNIIVLRKINTQILRLLGVRFFITDVPINTDAKLQHTLKEFPQFLYELDETNIGQYSPTLTILKTDAESSVQTLSQLKFDFQHSAVVHEPISQTLIPARDSKLSVDKNGYLNFSANSPGHSLVVLPIEYSHCLELTAEKNMSSAKLMRVDLLLTGILFSGKIDAKIRYFSGPFIHSECRKVDLLEAKKLLL